LDADEDNVYNIKTMQFCDFCRWHSHEKLRNKGKVRHDFIVQLSYDAVVLINQTDLHQVLRKEKDLEYQTAL